MFKTFKKILFFTIIFFIFSQFIRDNIIIEYSSDSNIIILSINDLLSNEEISNNGFTYTKKITDYEACSNTLKNDTDLKSKAMEVNDFLNTLYSILDILDNTYTFTLEPTEFIEKNNENQLTYKVSSKFNIKNKEDIQNYSSLYNILDLEYSLHINNKKNANSSYSDFILTLTDINSFGTIKLNNTSKDLLTVVYPDIDLIKLQNCIDNEYLNITNNQSYNKEYITNDKSMIILISGNSSNEKKIQYNIIDILIKKRVNMDLSCCLISPRI